MTIPQYAHVVFPDPVMPHHMTPDAAADDALAEKLAKYHATRAWGFHLGMQGGTDSLTALGVSMVVSEFHLARLYYLLCTEHHPLDRLDELAAEIGTTQRWQPENIAPELVEILAWAEIDPASIKAYRP
jgi:hypothetical protein